MKNSRWVIVFVLATMLFSISISYFSLYQTRASETALESVPAVSPLVGRSIPVGSAAPGMRLSLSINLSLHNTDDLKRYLQGEYTPGSLLYHRYLQPAQFAALYGPSAQDVQQVANYLRAQGFSVTHAVAGQQVIDFSGTVEQAEQSFAVQIHTYRAASGRVFYANSTSPLVPPALRPLIANINGLDNAIVRTHPPLNLHGLRISTRSPRVSGCPGPGTGSGSTPYLLPSQFASAYNYTGAYNAGLHGEGQSIALFELDSYSASDIAAFQSCYDANSPTRINNVIIDGGVSPPSSGADEVELDMEVLLGELSGLTNIFVYQAPNDSSDVGYNDEWNQIVQDNIPIVSTSWGLCEPDVSASTVAAEKGFFMQADAQGQSIVAAAGDFGAFDCNDGNLAVDDPGSSPYITGVGGTHLVVNSNNSYNSESAWSGTPNAYNGGGGGVSQLWAMSSYQSGPGVINGTYSSGSPCVAPHGQYCREVPDVALNADPNVGYVIYCTVPASFYCHNYGPWLSAGGTSAAAPMWAAVVALTNEYALAHGGTNLGFLNPTLYALLNSSTLYSRAFHDVTSGTNLHYPATANYDMATGIGSPNVYGFITNAPKLPGSPNVPGSTHWYLAEGHVGNNFQEYLTLENPSASSSAHVTVNYLLRGKPSFSQALTLSPSTRTTVNVNSVLNVATNASVGQDVSLYITADIAIVAERPIYFTYLGNTPGGSDIVGQTAPGMHFTFANGETVAGYSTYITVLNPIGQQTATVTASYYSGGTLIGQSSMTVPAGQRNTLMANNTLPVGKQFYIQVDSTQPIVVERPMYFRTSVAGISGTVSGGSSVEGVTPATNWYYASGGTGASGTPTQENLVIANSSGTTANVTITYAFASGTTHNVNVQVQAKRQLIENVNTDVGQVALVGIHVASTNGIAIVTERQQFFSAPALTPTATGVEEVGETPPNAGLPAVYSFAEGHLGNSFSEFITLFNPNNTPITVAVTYFITRGSSRFLSQETVSLAAMSVAQVTSNTFLNVPASSSGTIPEDTSIVVQSLPGNGGPVLPVIAGRLLYFNFMNAMPGCTSVVGFSG